MIADASRLSLTTFDVLDLNLATRFYSLFLPGGTVTATAVRVFKMVRVRKNYGGAIASIAVDRWITTFAMLCVGVLFGFVAWRPGQSGWLLIMLVALLVIRTPVR